MTIPNFETTTIHGHPHQAHKPRGQERTADDPQREKEHKPEDLAKEEQRQLIELVRKYKQSWFLRRRMIIKRVLKAYEFFKGNHFISFDPESFEYFDAVAAQFAASNSSNNNSTSNSEDRRLYEFVTNYYQMLGFAFVAALSAQLPKTRFLPENAEREEDIATAKAASRVQEIVERQNNIKSLHKQGLLFLWLAGCYFRHTRYLVDSDLAGTHKEPKLELKKHTLMPARYSCFHCGASVPADSGAVGRCRNCGAALSEQNYFPEEEAEIPVASGTEDVPNGMVSMTLYSPLHVDAAPYAKNLRETPILNVDEEVDIAALRASYPAQWDALKATLGPIDAEAQNERTARQMIYSEEGSRSNFIQDLMPTLSRTWIQPWAFNAVEDKQVAMKLRQVFPKGCLLVNAGDLFLEAREARLSDEWTWTGTVQETFGLFPPAVGDAAIPVQEQINDAATITHEYVDRLAAGILLVNENLVDSEALNNKPMAPGVLTGVKMKQVASAAGNRLEDAIVHIKADIDANIYSYRERLVFTAQLITGTPPQIFGGGGDPHIETASGQQQQLSTALGKLGLFWDNVREEHARAAEVAVRAASVNMTDDLVSVITDQSGQYRNQYVRLEEMQGNVHAYPETDQGFPMTFAEVKAFWERLIEFGAGGKNPYVNALLDEPTNQEQIATWTGVPGLIVPGRDMRNKVLRILDLLVQQQPIQQQVNGQVVEMPSIQPDQELDDLDIIMKTVRQWAQKNFDKQDENPAGFRNVVLYYKLAEQYQQQKVVKQAALMGEMGGVERQNPRERNQVAHRAT
ncbi:MAG TPA: hypothetical protein VG759_03185 [Candidatus Angelobacter sp.]|jgi:hypothetical protein|nr:hypothetical protein [Candidatus Angelobacter sp.]